MDLLFFREKNTNLRAEWNENLEKVSWNKRIQNENKKIQDEVRLAAKADIAVSLKAYPVNLTCTIPREGWLVGWLFGWLVGWLFGWLVVQLVGLLEGGGQRFYW